MIVGRPWRSGGSGRENELAGRSLTAKWALVGVGLLFVLSGFIVGILRWARLIPQDYGWLAPLFLALGAVGTLTAWFGLRQGRRWPLVILTLLYIPWTIIGLFGDAGQAYWLLVSAEWLGLLLVVWAIATITRRAVY